MTTGAKHRKKAGPARHAASVSKKSKPQKMKLTPKKHVVFKTSKSIAHSAPKAGKVMHKEPAIQPHGTHNHLWKNQLLQDADVRRWLIRSVGEHAIHVISDFSTPMSDEQIAQKSGIRASDVRVVLNKLHSYGLATYLRNRDKNSGWYSYVWKLNNEHAQGLKGRLKEEETSALTPEIPMGDGEYYSCNACGERKFDFERASNLLFKCDQCGQDLRFFENLKKA